jgi:hypothetical protein
MALGSALGPAAPVRSVCAATPSHPANGSKRRPPLSRVALRLREIHSSRRASDDRAKKGKAASIDASTAGPEDHVRMGGGLLVSVRRADRHELGSRSVHGHENGIVEQHQGDRVAVLLTPGTGDAGFWALNRARASLSVAISRCASLRCRRFGILKTARMISASGWEGSRFRMKAPSLSPSCVTVQKESGHRSDCSNH